MGPHTRDAQTLTLKSRLRVMRVDVVVVAYNSAATLRGCVEPLAAIPGVRVTVVDNASPDDSVGAIAGLDVDVVRAPRNGGFSYGCNLGAARGRAPYLLFLNPDARLDAAGARPARIACCATSPRRGWPHRGSSTTTARWPSACAASRGCGRPSRRRCSCTGSGHGRAGPTSSCATRRPTSAPARPEWVSGACMLVRRSAYEAIGGFDERFFLYCEDTDLCRRLWQAGHAVRFEPAAEVHHVGGASSGAGETQAIAARSRVLYARKHLDPSRPGWRRSAWRSARPRTPSTACTAPPRGAGTRPRCAPRSRPA